MRAAATMRGLSWQGAARIRCVLCREASRTWARTPMIVPNCDARACANDEFPASSPSTAEARPAADDRWPSRQECSPSMPPDAAAAALARRAERWRALAEDRSIDVLWEDALMVREWRAPRCGVLSRRSGSSVSREPLLGLLDELLWSEVGSSLG